MKPLKNETVVGVIIFCSMILGFLGLVWLEDYHFGGGRYIIVAHFTDVSGLNRGDPVTVSGLPIGGVQDMQLEEGGVAVTVWIEEKHPLPVGSQALIKSQGVMGERSVDIILGSGPQLLESGQSIDGLYQPDISQVVSQVGSVGDGLGEILAAIRSLLEDTSRGGLRQAISALGSTSNQLGDLVSRNAERLDETIAHLHDVSSTLASLDAGQHPETVLPNLEATSEDLVATARQLRDFTTSLDSLMQPTFDGHSTLGKLLSDPALYRECRILVGHLDSLALDIRRNPQRYVKIEIF